MNSYNKNKKFLFLKKRKNRKNGNGIFRTFMACLLIITITSSFFSFLDNKLTKEINERNNDLQTSTNKLPTAEEIINSILVINDVSAATSNYSATSLIPSKKVSLDGKPGDLIKYTLQYKNTGNYVWRAAGANQMVLRVKGNKSGALKSDKWVSNSVVANMNGSVINTSKIGEFDLTIKVPTTTTKETYVMYVKSFDQEVSGSEVEFTITPTGVATASIVTNTSSSNTTNNVILTKTYKVGDDNSEIKKLQQFLNNNGFIIATSGAGSKGKETTTFGNATLKALTNFQKKYNLSKAGTLTSETINFINNFKSSSSNTVTAQSSEDTKVSLEDMLYVSSDKDFDIIDSINSNTVLSVKAGEKVNVFFNQVTKTYSVSKNGLIYVTSKNKLNIKNIGNGTIDFGNNKKYSNAMLAMSSAFDVKVNTSSNGTVVCASVDCTLLDNNSTSVPANDTTNNTATNNNSTTSTGSVSQGTNSVITGSFNIRVGLGYDLLPATITNSKSYSIVDGENGLITQVNAGEQVIINYDKVSKIYSVTKNGVLVKQTVSYLKLLNSDNGIFTIVNMVQTPYGVNYNMFRGNLELRYNSTYDKAWIINELDIEDYLKGIGESSNSSSYEYLKVMAVTARTYAAYHYINPAKSAAQYFNVFSTTSDQVYYGYAREIQQPNVVKAANETKGMFITYNNNIIQAFYSANAGGMTRSVSETWGGTNLPYLKPVADKYTVNDTRFGHGVGMSQVGAIRMIAYDNADFVKVLTYYYTGVLVVKLY